MNVYSLRLQEQEKIISGFRRRIEFLSGRSDKYSTYRLIVFLTGAVLSIAGYFISKETGWILTIISIFGFSIAVHLHNKLLEGIRRCHTYMKIKEEDLARMKVEWQSIPDPAVNTSPDDMTMEKDLDLYGSRSVHNLIDVAISNEGSQLLREWISNCRPGAGKIIYRQNIVKELARMKRFRERFILKARLISKKFLDCGRIIKWIENSEDIGLPKYILPAAFVLITAYLCLFILNAFEIIPSYWIMFFGLYFILYSSNQKKISKIIEDSSELENQLKKFTSLIVYAESRSFKDQKNLQDFMRKFSEDGIDASEKLLNLRKIISAILIRENPLLRIILNILFPFDIFFSLKLNDLKTGIRANAGKWMRTLNELECFISLANFSYLNPDYVFPEIASEPNSFKAKELGHPLINRMNKVCNDFSFDKENEIVLITGSNMSGKSTFLRTAGVNLCLAYAGAPVNADSFRVSLYELFTCIKVTDSVIDGISYFYAEVRRLKQLLDEFENNNGLKKFFLIDEIFKGTNNKERLAGSRAFIKKLSELKGTGLISTHDLELVNIADEISSIVNYHFREEIVNNKMQFDYIIHTGPCPTTNALKIMKLSGLPVL